MDLSFYNIFHLALAGASLLASLLALRFIFKFARKIIRIALLLISGVLVAGYFLGFLDLFFG